jgi:RNA recognition motif-containing protein
VGDLGKEVNDDILKQAFIHYKSFAKSRVVRDKKTTKTKGYGFVSFKDVSDYTSALKEMQGKYIGNRPCKV